MINWHYSRTQMAVRHLEMLFDNNIPRLVFFGRRRIGKTEYLQQDLIPQAVERGISTIYASFWENKDQPHLGFIRALQSAIPEGVWKPKFKVGFSAGIEASVEIERADRPKAALPSELSIAANLFNEWIKHLNGKPGLIILDEIQHLATSSYFATFAASLRTLLDMAPPTIHVVFTGSSQADLQRLFQDEKAPFYSFATVQDFPPLEFGYIEHLTSIHTRITGKKVDAHDLWSVFDKVGRNAQILSGLVQQMVLQDTDDWGALWERMKEDLTGNDGYCERLWQELNNADRVVYLRLLEGKDLFSDESLALYEHQGFTRGTAQQAIKRLVNKSLVQRTGHGEYQRLVPLLDEWLTQAQQTSGDI